MICGKLSQLASSVSPSFLSLSPPSPSLFPPSPSPLPLSPFISRWCRTTGKSCNAYWWHYVHWWTTWRACNVETKTCLCGSKQQEVTLILFPLSTSGNIHPSVYLGWFVHDIIVFCRQTATGCLIATGGMIFPTGIKHTKALSTWALAKEQTITPLVSSIRVCTAQYIP